MIYLAANGWRAYVETLRYVALSGRRLLEKHSQNLKLRKPETSLAQQNMFARFVDCVGKVVQLVKHVAITTWLVNARACIIIFFHRSTDNYIASRKHC